MSFNIEVEGGKTVRLPTAGKYCDRDILVTAKGGAGDYYDTFWDAYQNNGNPVLGEYMFAGNRWTDDIFKPKYDIVVTNGMHLFSGTALTDIIALLKNAGVVFDFSKSTSTSYLIQNSNSVTTCPTVDCTSRRSMNYFIIGCGGLRVVEKVILKSDGSQTFTDNYSFNNLPALEEIRFEGVIGQNGFNMQWSTKLSRESIGSIVNALSDTTSGLAVTLSKTAKEAAFTAEEWAALIATKPNWTISLV